MNTGDRANPPEDVAHHFDETGRMWRFNGHYVPDNYSNITSDLDITLTFEKCYKLVINYLFFNGKIAAKKVEAWHFNGEEFYYASPTVNGYTPDKEFIRSDLNGMQAMDVTVDVYYSRVDGTYELTYSGNAKFTDDIPAMDYTVGFYPYSAKESYLRPPYINYANSKFNIDDILCILSGDNISFNLNFSNSQDITMGSFENTINEIEISNFEDKPPLKTTLYYDSRTDSSVCYRFLGSGFWNYLESLGRINTPFNLTMNIKHKSNKTDDYIGDVLLNYHAFEVWQFLSYDKEFDRGSMVPNNILGIEFKKFEFVIEIGYSYLSLTPTDQQTLHFPKTGVIFINNEKFYLNKNGKITDDWDLSHDTIEKSNIGTWLIDNIQDKNSSIRIKFD